MHRYPRIILILACIIAFPALVSCSLFPAANPDPSASATSIPFAETIITSDLPESSSNAQVISEETFAVETTAGSFAETSQSSTSSESKIDVTAPGGWAEDSNPTFIARYTKGDAFFLVAEELFFSSDDLDIITEEATATLLAVFENAQMVDDVEQVSIDGHEGRRFILTSTINGVPTTSSYTYIVLGDQVISFVFSQTSDLWPSFTDDEEAFLSDILIS